MVIILIWADRRDWHHCITCRRSQLHKAIALLPLQLVACSRWLDGLIGATGIESKIVTPRHEALHDGCLPGHAAHGVSDGGIIRVSE